jgi:hypothetical protein
MLARLTPYATSLRSNSRRLLVASLFAVAACALPDAAQQVPPETSAAPAALSAPPAAVITARVEALAPRVVEDGLGARIDAAAPVALSLGGGWSGRALDPVLVIGARRFTEYDDPAPGVLRYALPDRAILEGDAARVQWAEGDAVDVSAAAREALR